MFDRFFSKKEENSSSLKKIYLTSENQMEELLNFSKEKPVLLFKHSTRCGISNMVLKRFENKLANSDAQFYYYFLDLLQYRNLSNLIAEKFHIPHQSPQLIVFKNEVVEKHNSHYDIMEVTF